MAGASSADLPHETAMTHGMRRRIPWSFQRRGCDNTHLMSTLILVVALGAACAGFVQGLTGFAFGLVSLSIWAWVLDPMLAAVLAVFGSLVGQLIAVFSVRRGFDVKTLLPFLLGGVVGIP